MWRTLAWLTVGCSVIAALTGVIGALWAFHYYSRDLPDYRALANYQPATTTRLHAADGRLLAEYAIERRLYVPIDVIPDLLKKAFLAAEDQRFYEHEGIDFTGVVRAVITNVQNYGTGRRLVGASTITQQVAKNFLLTNEVSMERKIREAILAYRIERAFSKDRVLELYLNEIYLGSGSYGVAAAALNYFNKALDELTPAEAAYLAALPKAPNNYHPVRNPFAARARRDWVLDRMVTEGFLGAAAAAEAKLKPIELRDRAKTEYFTAEYFAEEVRRELVDLYGEKTLYEGGLSVRTTVNPRLQQAAEEALRAGLIAYDRRHGWRGPVAQFETMDDWAAKLAGVQRPDGLRDWRLAVVIGTDDEGAEIGFDDGERARIPFAELAWARPRLEDQKVGPRPTSADDVLAIGDVVPVTALAAESEPAEGDTPAPVAYALKQIPNVQGAIVAIDPHTGRVLAMQGGYSAEQSEFNRATQAKRQTGSAFKPFVYLAALDNGYTPATLILDAPFVLPATQHRERWAVNNYSRKFNGPTPMRVGIEKSYNAMTVRLAQTIGMDRVSDYVSRFGITDTLQPYLPVALGAEEATLLRMTAGYAMLVNGGKRVQPTLIDRIQDRDGRTIFRHDSRQCRGCRPGVFADRPMPYIADEREQLVNPAIAYQMTSMLEGVVRRGTAAKIGATLPDLPLAGKTGTTNDFRDAWFVGFSPDLAAGIYVGFDQPRSMGRKEAGSAVAAPIFQDFMAKALEGTATPPFRIPPGLRLVHVDRASGQRASPGQRGAVLEAFLPGTEPSWRPAFDPFVLDPSFDFGSGFDFAPLAEGAPFQPGGVQQRPFYSYGQQAAPRMGTTVIDSTGVAAPSLGRSSGSSFWPGGGASQAQRPAAPPSLPRGGPVAGSGGLY